jgi:hypothetical protein
MRRNVFVAFDDFVPASATTPVYTSQELNARLGQTDQFAAHIIIDTATGSPAPTTITLTVDHSGDGRVWSTKSTPFNNSTWGTNGLVFQDAGTTPTLAFVRFGITLNGTGGGAHVRINVTQRDQG